MYESIKELKIYINVYNYKKNNPLKTFSYSDLGILRVTDNITFSCWFFHYNSKK